MNRLGIAALLLLATAATVSPQARKRGPHIAGTKVDLAEALSYETPKPDGARSWTCNELARRIHGLEMMVAASKLPTFAQSYSTEAGKLDVADVQKQTRDGKRYYDQARGDGYLDQEELCGQGAGALGGAWEAWQPFLARQGLDADHYSGFKARNPEVLNEGDTEANDRGRVCNRGQYWDEDRAYWSINGREGICEQKNFEVHVVIKGSKSERGHRCFEYKLK